MNTLRSVGSDRDDREQFQDLTGFFVFLSVPEAGEGERALVLEGAGLFNSTAISVQSSPGRLNRSATAYRC